MNQPLNNRPKLFGLVGNHISYSLSPKIHNHVFSRFGIKALYGIFDIDPDHFDNAIVPLISSGIGINVTVPYKETIIKYLDSLSQEAELTGSVNLVSNRVGFNTDYLALRELVLENLSVGKNEECIILGSGGASRTAAFLLGGMGLRLKIFNRSHSRAAKLIDDLKAQNIDAQIYDINEKTILSADGVVSGISDPGFVFPEMKCLWAISFNYGDRANNFLEKIDDSCKHIISGEQILAKQAIYSQKIWNQIEPSFEDIMEVINGQQLR
ncbi:MAG: hypothetical protein M0T81_01870 [Thermoplasmatales archaeon]|nr:hypothetical protein [Thermoplasmatales archaeon]